MDCTRFGNKLNYYREKNDMTEKDLARKLHVPVRTVIKLENSEMEPNDRLVAKISNLFGVDFQDYLDLDERHGGAHHFDLDDPDYSPLTTKKKAKAKAQTQYRPQRTRSNFSGGAVIGKIISILLTIIALVLFIADDYIFGELLGMYELSDLSVALSPLLLIFASIVAKASKK